MDLTALEIMRNAIMWDLKYIDLSLIFTLQLMVSHREQECIDLAGKLIRNDRRRLPDKVSSFKKNLMNKGNVREK